MTVTGHSPDSETLHHGPTIKVHRQSASRWLAPLCVVALVAVGVALCQSDRTPKPAPTDAPALSPIPRRLPAQPGLLMTAITPVDGETPVAEETPSPTPEAGPPAELPPLNTAGPTPASEAPP